MIQIWLVLRCAPTATIVPKAEMPNVGPASPSVVTLLVTRVSLPFGLPTPALLPEVANERCANKRDDN